MSHHHHHHHQLFRRRHRHHGRSYYELTLPILRVARILVLALGLAAGVFFISGRIEKKEGPGLTPTAQDKGIVYFGGEAYKPRESMSTMLFLGTDRRESESAETALYARNEGQADFILLLAENNEDKCIIPILIDRDTMTEIAVTNIMGKRSGTRSAQLCLAYAFGSNDKESCLLTGEAVSKLFSGLAIDHYVSLNMKDVAAVNDSAGGVTVTIKDDFSKLDSAMKPGTTLTLTGSQAELFVRARMQVGSGTNAERMNRQQTYMDAFIKRIREGMKTEGDAYILKLIDTVDQVVVKDMNDESFLDHLLKRLDYEWTNVITITGEHVVGDSGFMEFYPDDESLEDIRKQVFYTKVKDEKHE